MDGQTKETPVDKSQSGGQWLESGILALLTGITRSLNVHIT